MIFRLWSREAAISRGLDGSATHPLRSDLAKLGRDIREVHRSL